MKSAADKLKAFTKAGKTGASPTQSQKKRPSRANRPIINEWGRPAKRKPLMCYLTDEDYETVREAAEAVGLPLSIFVRQAAMRDVKKVRNGTYN